MRWSWLTRNHGNRTPGALISVDTESHEEKGGARGDVATYPLRLGVARYCRVEGGRPSRRDHLRFTDAATFWEWVRSKLDTKRVTWLWAHNLGWDLAALRFWRELEEGNFTLEGPPRRRYNREAREWQTRPTWGHLITSDPPTSVRCWDRAGKSLRCCDTYNWYRHSLKTIGHTLGLEKGEFPGVAGSDDDLWPYCERDCEIVEAAVLELVRFVKQNDLGNFRITPAAQALAAFRHWLRGPVVQFNPEDSVAEFERLSYWGGRVCVYFAGRVRPPGAFALEGRRPRPGTDPTDYGGPVHQYDLSAAYASVMRGNLYPCKLVTRVPAERPEKLLRQMKEFGAAAVVLIESYDEPYPYRDGERTRWQTGTFTSALCGPELRRALESGHVKWIWEVYYYELAELFTEFVDALTRIEESYPRDTDPVRRELAKLIRNSLYGKFGQRKQGWDLVEGERADSPWGHYVWQLGPGKGFEHRRAVAWQFQRRVDEPRVQWTFPAISAYVCAYCRERMRQLRAVAGVRNVYYQDADALHVSAAGAELLDAAGEIADDRPGKLRLVDVCDDVSYFGCKNYRWGEKEVNAGLHRAAKPAGGGRYTVQDFLRIDQHLKDRPPAGGLVVTKEVEAPRHDLGAERGPDGWTTPLPHRGPTIPGDRS